MNVGTHGASYHFTSLTEKNSATLLVRVVLLRPSNWGFRCRFVTLLPTHLVACLVRDKFRCFFFFSFLCFPINVKKALPTRECHNKHLSRDELSHSAQETSRAVEKKSKAKRCPFVEINN